MHRLTQAASLNSASTSGKSWHRGASILLSLYRGNLKKIRQDERTRFRLEEGEALWSTRKNYNYQESEDARR